MPTPGMAIWKYGVILHCRLRFWHRFDVSQAQSTSKWTWLWQGVLEQSNLRAFEARGNCLTIREVRTTTVSGLGTSHPGWIKRQLKFRLKSEPSGPSLRASPTDNQAISVTLSELCLPEWWWWPSLGIGWTKCSTCTGFGNLENMVLT